MGDFRGYSPFGERNYVLYVMVYLVGSISSICQVNLSFFVLFTCWWVVIVDFRDWMSVVKTTKASDNLFPLSLLILDKRPGKMTAIGGVPFRVTRPHQLVSTSKYRLHIRQRRQSFLKPPFTRVLSVSFKSAHQRKTAPIAPNLNSSSI